MAKYLVTGGAGFIGSNLVRYLLDRKDEVRVLDNFSTGKRQNLAEVADRIALVEGDLCDAEVTEQAVRGVDFVLHQAAIPSVPRSVEATSFPKCRGCIAASRLGEWLTSSNDPPHEFAR